MPTFNEALQRLRDAVAAVRKPVRPSSVTPPRLTLSAVTPPRLTVKKV